MRIAAEIAEQQNDGSDGGERMRLYMAPLEGITGYIYRHALADFFGGADRYFMPFFSPHLGGLTAKELRELSPEYNKGLDLVPQILTDNAEAFVQTARKLQAEGFSEVNLNLGCPSGTVVSKGRGSGFLARTAELERFLDEVFAAIPPEELAISVKTRVGLHEPEEFAALLGLYNAYPICELTVHPRTGKEMYRPGVHMECYAYAREHSRIPLCYNGDLRCLMHAQPFMQDEKTQALMLGRGVLRNPALLREIAGGPPLSVEELTGFLERLLEDYTGTMSGAKPTLYKMKELWSYLGDLFPEELKLRKKLLKSTTIEEFRVIQRELLRGEMKV